MVFRVQGVRFGCRVGFRLHGLDRVWVSGLRAPRGCYETGLWCGVAGAFLGPRVVLTGLPWTVANESPKPLNPPDSEPSTPGKSKTADLLDKD